MTGGDLPDRLRLIDEAIGAYYDGPAPEPPDYKDRSRPTGGALHVVLDDGNWDRRSVESCRQAALSEGDSEGVAIADMLLALSDRDRHRLVGNPGSSYPGVDDDWSA